MAAARCGSKSNASKPSLPTSARSGRRIAAPSTTSKARPRPRDRNAAMLPEALKEAIARRVEGLSRTEIAQRAEKLSEHYRRGRTSKIVGDPLDVAAYLLVRMPATYAATYAVLSEVALRAPSFAPTQSLDAGAGPGTASWAAAATWPDIGTVRMLDSNPQFLQIARTLTSVVAHPQALAKPQIVARDLGSAPLASADLVIAG